MRKNKDEKTPILYRKFQQDQEEKPLEYPEIKSRRSILKILSDMLVILILMGLIFLAAIGTLTLVNPGLRAALIEIIYLNRM